MRSEDNFFSAGKLWQTQCVEKQRHYSADKVPYSQGCDLPSGHIWSWELDHKEGRAPKNWCLWTLVLEKTSESPLDIKEIKPVNLKGNQPWILIGRTDAEAESENHSIISDFLWPHGLYSPWNSPGQDTGVGSLSLLQGIFLTQISNPSLLCLLHWHVGSLPLVPPEKPYWYIQFSSVQSLSRVQLFWPHELQHARPPCPSPTPRVHPNPRPLSWWCHPTISSSVVPFSSSLQSFPASGSFQMSQLFASGGQNIGVSASTSVLPMNTQDWFPFGWTDWTSLQSKGFSRVFSNTTVQKHQFFGTQLSLWSNSHPYMTTGKTIALIIWTFVQIDALLIFSPSFQLLFNLLVVSSFHPLLLKSKSVLFFLRNFFFYGLCFWHYIYNICC